MDTLDDGLEMDEYGDVRPRRVVAVPVSPAVVSHGDIVEMARSELPGLVAHAIALAKGSTRLNEVVAVIKELGDRGYGKPAQSVDMRTAVSVEHKIEDSTRATLERFARYALERHKSAMVPVIEVEVNDE